MLWYCPKILIYIKTNSFIHFFLTNFSKMFFLKQDLEILASLLLVEDNKENVRNKTASNRYYPMHCCLKRLIYIKITFCSFPRVWFNLSKNDKWVFLMKITAKLILNFAHLIGQQRKFFPIYCIKQHSAVFLLLFNFTEKH